MGVELFPGFRRVDRTAFDAAIAAAPLTELMRQQYARYSPNDYDGWDGPDYRIHDGDLIVDGHLNNVGFNTLVTGSITATGLVDLRNPHTEPNNHGFDEGGLFMSAGDITCRALGGEGGKCTFIDGDLRASDFILNGFGNSSIVVSGRLTTRLFLGHDIWAEVGNGADLEYGIGYCLPIGYTNASSQAINPQHTQQQSIAALVFAYDNDRNLEPFYEAALKGRSVFQEA